MRGVSFRALVGAEIAQCYMGTPTHPAVIDCGFLAGVNRVTVRVRLTKESGNSNWPKIARRDKNDNNR
jgi:hypothetical protein